MLISLLILVVIGSAVADSDAIVETVNGKVRGKSLKTFGKNNFYAFQGIPFAEPPLGDLRFKPPQPPKNWDGVLDSRNAVKNCVQANFDFVPGEGEDCLYLNVYTPEIPTDNKNVSLPVMVYIHGGAFVFGSNSMDHYRPYKIMDTGIVMVAIQYRVGFLGFLSTGDLECPGNNGFKDQQFALKWVQNNIRSFGGDPTRVTISGQSAGATSVGYQMLAAKDKGLFRGVIQASASPLGSCTLQRNPKSNAYLMAKYINPAIDEANTSTKDLMSFFKTLTVSQIKNTTAQIFNASPILASMNSMQGFLFSTTIEPEHDGAFITETAFKLIESGDFNVVPLFTGITSEESRSFVTGSDLENLMIDYDKSTDLIVSPSMHITDLALKRKLGEDVRRLYVGKELFQKNLGPSMTFLSDAAFGRPNIKHAKLQAKYADVYFYEFAYSGELGRKGKNTSYYPGAESVGHSEDLSYVFPEILENISNYSEKDLVTIDRMTLLWTNFVKYLNPTPKASDVLQNVIWPKVTTERFPYLYINETIEVKHDLKQPMTEEYERLFDQYAVRPLDTY
ncbi:hypothetical protein WA026_010726 [Henosepilachna vigintioctopunctata]|uniref:Carboxylic ester hydrolase n=1 Tax=Henosepilachna vigintioctopunctata TaxID=420089 RepID=A0AAW1UNY8_9CUCU